MNQGEVSSALTKKDFEDFLVAKLDNLETKILAGVNDRVKKVEERQKETERTQAAQEKRLEFLKKKDEENYITRSGR